LLYLKNLPFIQNDQVSSVSKLLSLVVLNKWQVFFQETTNVLLKNLPFMQNDQA
jgi:hypothetical protein